MLPVPRPLAAAFGEALHQMCGKWELLACFLGGFLYICTNFHKNGAMKTIRIKDKTFAVSLPEEEILKQVRRVAGEISRDLAGQTPLFLAVLNGSFIFAADLLREVTLPCEISFVKLASYEGVSSTGTIKEVIGLSADITGRAVVIVEDIVDSGLTMAHMLETLSKQNPASIDVCTLLVKPGNMKVNLDIKYKCLEIPNDFIVGYGLDYDGQGRNTRDIYTVVEEENENS